MADECRLHGMENVAVADIMKESGFTTSGLPTIRSRYKLNVDALFKRSLT
jgi:hypothetical protein